MVSSRLRRPHRQSVAIGTNPERNRAHNRRVVLEAIRIHGHLGRTEIARHARLTAQAVANIVEDLLAEGLLVELGRLRSGRGQPPIQFAMNPDGPLTAGIEVAAGHLSAVLMDLSGGTRASAVLPLPVPSPEAVGVRLPGLLAGLWAEAQADRVPRPALAEGGDGRFSHAGPGPGAEAILPGGFAPATAALPGLLGVGVVMPGPFEVEGMSSVGPATLPGWAGVDPAEVLRRATGHAVHLENDATAAAVGERLCGAGRQIGSFCYLYFGIGLGLGVIQDGRPMRGAFGNAGEIGHVALVPRRGAALPGPAGALERFASVFALRDHLAAAGLEVAGVEDIARLHAAGSAPLQDWIQIAADHLAPAVALIENIFDPETVIFGGGLPDSVLEAMIAALHPLPVSVATRRRRVLPRVLRGQTGQLTAAIGAAALPLLDAVSPHLSVAVPAG